MGFKAQKGISEAKNKISKKYFPRAKQKGRRKNALNEIRLQRFETE